MRKLEVKATKRLAVFVSGGGSNFKQIHAGCQNGSINGSIEVRLTDITSPTHVQLPSAVQSNVLSCQRHCKNAVSATLTALHREKGCLIGIAHVRLLHMSCSCR
jgi:folate-dependent phosphoribosylglycinamide formyltransferase PurN